jgi:hypothetical protein
MAYSFTSLMSVIMRRYNTDGVSASGAKSPVKADLRTWGGEVEAAVTDIDTRLTAAEASLAPLLYDPQFGGGAPATPPAGFSTETYIDESRIPVPDNYLQVGSEYVWVLHATKDANGVAAPVFKIRIGTGGNVADATRCTLTFDAQTAAADEAWITIRARYRSVGNSSAAVLVATGIITHELAATGFSTKANSIALNTSSGFGSDPAGNASFAALTLTAGASANWTIDYVSAELRNLA